MAPKPHNRKDRKVSLQTTSTAPAKHSFLHHYAQPKGKAARRKAITAVLPIETDDPYAFGELPTEKAPPKGTETVNPEARELIVAEKKPIVVYASKRDVIAGMYARGQIDKAMYLGAIEYAGTFERAMALSVRGVDTSAPVVSGGSGNDMVDTVAEAVRRLARLEARIRNDHGRAGVNLVRDVLGDGLTIERSAKRRGGGGRQAAEWCGGTLRRCMEVLAEACGHAVRGAYRNRQRQEERRERDRKRQEARDRAQSKRRKKGKAQ